MVYNKHMKRCLTSSVIRETQHTRSQLDFISHTDLKITFLGKMAYANEDIEQ